MTTQPITIAATTQGATLPEFGRWQDVQLLFGIKRGTLYNLVNEGQIKSVSLRRRGNVHGCRLFHLASINDYLASLMTQQQGSRQA